ncbi:MAG: hypothetical protein QM578_09910 [Pantoea sp.]|uniref:hypothetical protein n=1 Tax=Pantoea sp. TaxID=69393 RepID=UPI0039E3FEE5
MHSTKSNREVVKAGHEFSKALTVETTLIDIAKMISDLATRLDVANTQANIMAGEVLRLNALIPAVIKALQSAGDHESLIADLNEAMITDGPTRSPPSSSAQGKGTKPTGFCF